MKIKQRLDERLLELFPTRSRTFLQSMIMQGKVTVDGTVVTKPGVPIKTDSIVQLNLEEPKFVSRAGFKLEQALNHFGIDVTGMVALDAGLSTGGFTDCLVQRGIAKVYGVDVGYGQVHEKIRQDQRVVVMERTNLRHLETLPELVDIVTLDLSFISVLKVLDVVKRILKAHGKLIVLIKPQFEAERHEVGRGGIIKDAAVHQSVIQKVTIGIEQHGFTSHGVIDSPFTGADGNKEFLAYFTRNT